MGMIGITYGLLTLAFIFWFVYLLQDVIKRRSCYRSALKEIDESNDDKYQLEVAYNANTEYVKSKFLFFINIVEWIAGMFAAATSVYLSVRSILVCNQKFPLSQPEIDSTVISNLTVNASTLRDCTVVSSYSDSILAQTYSILLILSYNSLLLVITLVSCLCNYLTARYARKSWIKHNKIPYIITLTVAFIILTQILSLFCFLTLIVRWVHLLVLVLVLAFGIHQSRKLRMVINWTLVDLEISQNDRKLLNKFKRMNKRLSIFFAIFWLGCVCLLLLICSINMRITLELTLQLIYQTDYSLCNLHNVMIPTYILAPLRCFQIISSMVGFLLVYLPYLLIGFGRMSVMTWLCIKGRTGYQTHFHVHLKAPLL